MKNISIVAFDKFTDIDIFLAWDLFNPIRFLDGEITVKIVGLEKEQVSVSGLKIPMHDPVEICSKSDIVFFGSGPGTRKLIKDPKTLKRFSLDPSSQLICSMCSGALILAALGLLDGLTATTYPTAINELKSFGVEIEDKPLVAHGNIATAAGCLAAIDLTAWAIEKVWSTDIMKEVIASVQPAGKSLECLY